MQGITFFSSLLISLIISIYYTSLLCGKGSDHPVHIFLVNVIRESNHRLFNRVPRILNEAYCGAYPLFLHWVLSFFSLHTIDTVARILNPSINLALVLLLYSIMESHKILYSIFGLTCLIFILTPQFYHAGNARNFGISSRPIGLILFILYSFLIYNLNVSFSLRIFLGSIFVGYLIWGFNTFAQQTMILFGIIWGLVFHNWIMLGLAFLSIVPFIILHPKYSISYLKHTVLFIKTYATDIADVYILKSRYSIWRDLIYDVWIRIRKFTQKDLYYIYNNSFLVILFLNPLIFIASFVGLSGYSQNSLLIYCSRMALLGLLLFILTSFRSTRFLGEPERYVEMVTPFSTIAAVFYIMNTFGLHMIVYLIIYFVIMTLLQLIVAYLIKENASHVNISSICQITKDIVGREFQTEDVRFCSNNEELTKYFMTEKWCFARSWSPEVDLGGEKYRNFFSQFPMVRKQPFENILTEYKINLCLLDKNNFHDIFIRDLDHNRIHIICDSEYFRLYHLKW